MDTGYSIGKSAFMLSNKNGGYAYFSDKPKSRYQGFFFCNNLRMFKIIEDIGLVNKAEMLKLNNKFYCVERERKGIIESFFMPKKYNSMVYGLSKDEEIELVLDVKDSYDNREFGRIYDIEVSKDKIVVKFTKRTNAGEDDSEDQEEYSLYLAIKPDKLNYEVIDEWNLRTYADDIERKSMPFERYVYFALKLKARNIVFSVSEDREKAVKEADYVFKNKSKLKKESETDFKKIIKNPVVKKIKDKQLRLAYVSALNSLEKLKVKTNREEGIFAGLPWFFQLWARDELISLGAVKKKSMIKNVLMRYFFRLKNSMLRSKPDSELAAIDAVGWLYFRAKQAIDSKVFNANEIKKITKLLEKNIIAEDNIAKCSERESWMDAIDRNGALIELQAMKLFSLRLLSELTKDNKFAQFEKWLKEKVRQKFWNGKYLVDRLEDNTIRPNLFIAAYIYPDLLSKEEWVKCFDNVLPKLFLGWGGLSTIDRTNELFEEKHTGEEPKSYHNGDSWFWINNLAAIVLNRINSKKYCDYIKKILNASAKEILSLGIVGSAAELSSASSLKSEGCLNQAWSSAMFIELVEELFL